MFTETIKLLVIDHYLDCLLNSAQTMAAAVAAFKDSAVSDDFFE
jgi:hypothetical protein